MTEDIRRVRFHQGQYLGADDLDAEQRYHRDLRRRHNVGQHTWGVVAGLDLQVEDTTRLWVGPGMAIDGFGREIFVLAAAELGPEAFLAEDLATGVQPVWLAYHEEAAVPARYGYAECADGTLQRVVENHRLAVGPPEIPDGRDPVVVAGEPGDTGASIPYQELPPDDRKARWFVLLGEVFWDRGAGALLNPDEGRRPYAGAVAQTIWAPAGDLRLADRRAAADLRATVEGKLDVDDLHTARGDVELHGTRLVALGPGGGGIAVWLGRNDPGGKGGVDLRLEMGENPDPALTNRMAVQAGGEDRLTVAEDGATDVRGDTTIREGKQLRLDGGALAVTRRGVAPPHWLVRQPEPGDGDELQFRERINEDDHEVEAPDGEGRIVLELLHGPGKDTDPVLRLNGRAGATLSAQQLMDLTHGQITELHAHPFATTVRAGRVEVANHGETAEQGESTARLVVAADDPRLLTPAQRAALTGGGVTALHRHSSSTINDTRQAWLYAEEGGTDTFTVDLGVARRVLAAAMLVGTERGGGGFFGGGDYGDAYAEVYAIDDLPGGSWASGGRNFGPPGSQGALRGPSYLGAATRITFRLRSFLGRSFGLGLVFYEAL